MSTSNACILNDRTGQTFGSWYVLRRAPSRKHHTYWLCRCNDCGKEKEVNASVLGKTTRCLQCANSKKAKEKFNDLSGQMFGKLLVLSRSENSKNGNYRWNCRCLSCNREFASQYGSVINNRFGCTKCTGKNRFDDLTGQTIDSWTILGRGDGAAWKCRCKCGKEFTKSRHDLNRYKSCITCENTSRLGRSYISINSPQKTTEYNRRPRKVADHTGMVFGKRAIIGRAPSRRNQPFWTCRCECGSVDEVAMGELRKGKSNGCAKCSKFIRVIDLTGQTFGLWTVIKYAGKSLWLCRCKGCDQEFNVDSGGLRSGNSGCRRCSGYRMQRIESRFGTIRCQGYEDRVLKFLDQHCPDVVKVERGPSVPSWKPKIYLHPDFLITRSDGSRTLLEIKSVWTLYGTPTLTKESRSTDKYLYLKRNYQKCRTWCRQNECNFVLWCINDQRSFKRGLTQLGYSSSTITMHDFKALRVKPELVSA